MDEPAVDIITVLYDSAVHLPSYAEALATLDYPADKLRLIIVDNASRDRGRELMQELAAKLPFPTEFIDSDVNLGFGPATNLAAQKSTAPFLLILNPDTSVAHDMLRQMVRRALREPEAGLVDATQEPQEIRKWRDPESGYTDWCSGGAVLARRKAFDDVGGFDPYFFLYCEDVDLSWKMWLKGWRCVSETKARVRHNTTDSSGSLKPATMYYSILNSFAMRFIYDTPAGVRSHFVRGLRYLSSPKTEAATRRAVGAGLMRTLRTLPYLSKRRRETQRALENSAERARFVFTEWFYGRFVD